MIKEGKDLICFKCKTKSDLLISLRNENSYYCRNCYSEIITKNPEKKYDNNGNFICQWCKKVLNGKSKGRAKNSDGFYTDFCQECWNKFEFVWIKQKLKLKEKKNQSLF